MDFPFEHKVSSSLTEIGLALIRIDPEETEKLVSWRIAKMDGSFLTEPFFSLLELWDWLLEYSAYALSEERKLGTFVSLYESHPDSRSSLVRDLGHMMTSPSPCSLSNLLTSIENYTAQTLPTNWRMQLSSVLRLRGTEFSFYSNAAHFVATKGRIGE